MKRFCVFILSILLFFTFSCKKEASEKVESPTVKKYATLRISVYKDKELKNWAATLEKAEEINFISEEKVLLPDKKNNEIVVAKVKLADDTIGYTNAKYLADRPIVFIEDAKLHIRPTVTSSVYTTVPKGTLGFITSEKDGWVEVFIGYLPNGKWVEGKWANTGYDDDIGLVVDAARYEKALNLLNDTSKPDNRKQAETILHELSEKQNIIGELAIAILNESVEKSIETVEADTRTDRAQDVENQ